MVHTENDSHCCKKYGPLFDDAEERDAQIQNKHTGILMSKQCGRSFVSRKGLSVHKTTTRPTRGTKICIIIFRDTYMLTAI